MSWEYRCHECGQNTIQDDDSIQNIAACNNLDCISYGKTVRVDKEPAAEPAQAHEAFCELMGLK